MGSKNSSFLPLDFELAKELKEAGYSQYGKNWWVLENHETEWKEVNEDTHLNFYELGKRLQDSAYLPTLSELIRACDVPFERRITTIHQQAEPNEHGNGCIARWYAHGVWWDTSEHDVYGEGDTPEQAVARLWIALKKGKS